MSQAIPVRAVRLSKNHQISLANQLEPNIEDKMKLKGKILAMLLPFYGIIA
jgi:hypothetical protein